MDSKKIIQKSGIYFIGNLASKFLSSLLLPIYASFVMADQLGEYDIVATISSIAMPVCFLNISETVIRFVIKEKNNNSILERCSTILASVFFSCSFIIVLSIMLSKASCFNYSFYTFTCFYVIITGLVQILQEFCRAFNKTYMYAISGVISTIANFICVILFVCIFKLGTKGLIISTLVGQVIIIIVLAFSIKIWNYFDINKINFKLLKNMYKYSIPLVLNSIVAWIISGYSKIIINSYVGLNANGLYAFANKFSSLIITIGSMFSMALFEEAVKSSDDSNFNKAYGDSISNLNCIYICLCGMAVPLINIFYDIFVGSEYVESKSFVPLLLVYAVLMNFSTNVGSLFQINKKTEYQFIATTIGSIISCVSSYLLVVKYGVMGVILGQTIGAISLVIARLLFIKKITKFNIEVKNQILQCLIFVIIVFISKKQSMQINLLIFIMIVVLECYIYRNQIKNIILKYQKVNDK